MNPNPPFVRPALSVAPMMDCTDRHYRYFIRCITGCSYLYTEMISTGAIVHGDRRRLLDFDPCESPVALQIGGSDIDEAARAVAAAEPWPYEEINLNVGCPSDRVQERGLGACLMLRPEHVARMVEAMRANTSRPVTVKHRIGVDDLDRYEDLVRFVSVVRRAGPARFTVHARIAWLEGLSPKENRNIPPLRYDDVYRLKREFPQLDIEINGHIESLADVDEHLRTVDAVMIGRAAYDTPWIFSAADRFLDERGIAGSSTIPAACSCRAEVVERMIPYVERWYRSGMPGRRIVRHMLGLFAGMPGARHWRRGLSGRLPDDCVPILRGMLEELPHDSLHAPADEPPPVEAPRRVEESVPAPHG